MVIYNDLKWVIVGLSWPSYTINVVTHFYKRGDGEFQELFRVYILSWDAIIKKFKRYVIDKAFVLPNWFVPRLETKLCSIILIENKNLTFSTFIYVYIYEIDMSK